VRFDEIDGEDVDDPGVLASFGRALRQGVNPFWDEMAGAGEAWKEGAERLLKGEAPTPTDTLNAYRRGRDGSRAADDVAEAYHPAASTAGALAGGLAQGLAVPGSKFTQVVGGGAATGALSGLGGSRADLTDADLEDYIRAMTDTAEGAALGGALGGAFHGVAAGARWLGGKAAGALSRARGQLVAEEGEALAREAAEREAPELARRAKEQERLAREQGQALEMNKAVSKRAAREEQRAANAKTQVVPSMQEPRAPALRRGAAPTSDPNDTNVLRGYQGAAGERRAVNFDRVQAYRQRLEDPRLPEAERERLGRYIAQHGDAVDNPGAFERRRIEQELRKRYPAQEVDSIMRERVTEDGRILSRAELGERTQPGDMGDVLKQGRAEEVRRLGGGGSAWEDASRTELVPREMSDAPTRVALVRTSPDGGYAGLTEGGALHTFEFKPRGHDEIFEVVANEVEPGVIHIETVKPVRASSVEEMHGDVKNLMGPGLMKDLSRDLARAFPGARRITGANVGHSVDIRAPEVTQPLGLEDVARQGRAEDVRRMGGGGSAWEASPQPLPDDMAAPMDRLGVEEPVERTIQAYSPLASRPALRPGVEGLPGTFRERPTPRVAPEAPAAPEIQAAPPAPAPRRPGTNAARPSALAAQAQAAPTPAPTAAPRPSPVPAEDELAALQRYLDEVEAAPGDAQARASAREAGAMRDVARAGYQGVQGARNTLGAMLGGGVAITREALRSPAVRARALSALQVQRLARVNPAVFARVGAALRAAMQQGPEEYETAVHVLNQTDPEFRAANRQAEQEMQRVPDEQLEAELRAAGML